ncbi:MAG: VWA domain-containing protein [Ardenticatenales bacterium]
MIGSTSGRAGRAAGAIVVATALLGAVGANGVPAAHAALPDAYTRIASWPSRPMPPTPGRFLAAAGLDIADDGTIFVADTGAGRVHVLGADGAPLRLIGRPGSAAGELDAPSDVAQDGGRLYVTDTGNQRIEVFDAANGAFEAEWPNVGALHGIAVGDGKVFASDPVGRRIRVFDLAGSPLATWGDGGTVALDLSGPRGLDYRNGRLYIADLPATRILICDTDGLQVDGFDSPSTNLEYDGPVDVASDDDGQFFFATVRRLMVVRRGVGDAWDARPQGPYIYGGFGLALGPGPGLAVTVQDGRAEVTGVQRFPDRGNLGVGPLDFWGDVPVAVGALDGPRRIAAAGDGTVYILDNAPRVQVWRGDGTPLRHMRLEGPTDIAGDPLSADAFVSTGKDIRRIRSDGTNIWTWTPPGQGAWLLAAAAADGLVAIDAGQGLLARIDAAGNATTSPLGGLIVDIAAGGGRVVVADRTAAALRVIGPDGTETARWPVATRILRVAGTADGDRWFALTADGWVWAFDNTGTARAAFDASAGGAAVDLAVDPTGRVLVLNGDHQQIDIWALDPNAAAPEPPPPDDRCIFRATKTAGPAQVRVDAAVTVELGLTGGCPSQSVDLDLVMVIDRSGSMEGPKLSAAQQAAIEFTNELDFARVRTAIVSFSDAARVAQGLTNRRESLVQAIAGIQPGGNTDIAAAITESQQELAGPRGRSGAPDVIVLMTDGKPNSDIEAAAARAAAIAARQAGIQLYTIGLGGDVDAALLAELAGDPDRSYSAPSQAELTRIYTLIARRLSSSVLIERIQVDDELPSDMVYVADSANPPATFDGASLHWTLTAVPATGFKLRYVVRPQRWGNRPTNVRATGAYTDGVGFGGRVVFPVPSVEVLGDHRAFLPILYRTTCPTQRTDVVLAIDTSSSMQELDANGDTLLAGAKHAARTFIDLLALPNDQAAVVSFNTDALLVQPLTGDAAVLKTRIDGLPSAQGTRIDRGLAVAFDELMSPRRRPANLPVLILLTDGQPQGGTEANTVATARRVRDAGIIVYTVGLGPDVDGGFLIGLAGMPERYLYAPTPVQLLDVYRSIAMSLPCR